MSIKKSAFSIVDWRDKIDPLSLIPLHIETFFDNHYDGSLRSHIKIADATGFIYVSENDNYLITNWHVITGRNAQTKQPFAKEGTIPNILKVWFHSFEGRGWFRVDLPLFNLDNKPLWKEHIKGSFIDVVALPLNNILVKTYPLDPVLFNTKLDVFPAESISVIGFPFGLPSIGMLPIWKIAHVASDIDENYEGKPVFLADGAMRPGMSGSPVFARKKELISEDKRIFMSFSNADKFLGIFSGDISNKYDTQIGMVWKPEVINEIIDQKDEICNKIVD